MASEKDFVKKATHNALKLMRDSGFEIKEKLEVVVDPDLPFMGYSTQRRDGHVIVVAGMALQSGAIEGLLIHEMCHIYRTEANHPSHSRGLLNRVGLHVIHEYHLTEDYQVKIIQQAVNHIQDLYADDLAFKVFEKSKAFPPEQAFAFFLDWIQDTPTEVTDDKDKWQNIGTMLNNCFALSNLTRHEIPDINNQAETKTQKLLSQVTDKLRKESTYFRNFMTNLARDPTPEQFEQDLSEYLKRIVELAK